MSDVKKRAALGLLQGRTSKAWSAIAALSFSLTEENRRPDLVTELNNLAAKLNDLELALIEELEAVPGPGRW